MNRYEVVKIELRNEPKTWLITGVAGFVGSNLLEALLWLDQLVVGLDNFSTGYQRNLDEVESEVTAEQWKRFRFIEDDIRNLDDCSQAVKSVAYVLHHAALGSVLRSIDDPAIINAVKVAVGMSTIVNSLSELIDSGLREKGVLVNARPNYQSFQAGDIRYSLAGINRAKQILGYEPKFNVIDGIRYTITWYSNLARDRN